MVASYSKASQKMFVLSLLQNVDTDDEFLMTARSRFQMDGAEDWKACGPTTVFVRGTDNVHAPVDLNE